MNEACNESEVIIVAVTQGCQACIGQIGSLLHGGITKETDGIGLGVSGESISRDG